jgi:transposase-like protein
MVRELSVQEQKYQAVMAVLSDGFSVSEVAQRWGVSRQSVHAWLRRYEDRGLAGLEVRSSRPDTCPHQMPGVVEAAVLELLKTVARTSSGEVRKKRATNPHEQD